MQPSDPQPIAVAVVQDEMNFLVGQRPPGVPLAGYWEFPGGKQNAGETAAEAAVRECFEETGLVVEIIKQLSTVEHRYEHGELVLRFFLCRTGEAGAASPRPPFRWVSASKLAQLKFPPANQTVIEGLSRTAADSSP